MADGGLSSDQARSGVRALPNPRERLPKIQRDGSARKQTFGLSFQLKCCKNHIVKS